MRSRGAFTVSGRTTTDKEPTVQAYGANTPIAGVRSDLIVLDDSQDPVRFRTQGFTNTDKMVDWFREDVLGRLYDHQKLVVIGNRLGPQDFVGRLIELYGDDWTVVYYPAITNYEAKRVLVPELWTFDALMRKKKEVGEEVWTFQWQQEEIDEANATFTQDAMDSCKDFDRALGEVPDQASYIVVGLDPAVSGFNAVVVWGVDADSGRRYLIDFYNETNMRTEDIIAGRVAEVAKTYDADKVVVEVRNIQGSIFLKVKELLRGSGIRVMDYKTATATGAQATEQEFDITSVAQLFDDRMVSIPYKLNDAHTKKQMDVFIHQFRLWRPRPPEVKSWKLVRDLVMATLFAESEARKFVRLAQRKIPKVKPNVPAWTQNPSGGYAWQKSSEEDEYQRLMKEWSTP